MTASAKFTNEDKTAGNKNTTAETRRASKPLMEKKRRARINQSLAILKTLIVDSQRVEGNKQSKLEKADILEMTVSHLQSVKKTDEQKFMEGFEECFSEATRFLEKSKINTSIVDKLTDHMKRFKQGVELPTSFSQAGGGPKLPVSNNNNMGNGSSIIMDEEPIKLLPIAPTKSVMDPSPAATFALNVPRLKRESSFSPSSNKTKKAPSSTHSHSSCLSPSPFSNDSNNNNFVPEVDSFRDSVSSPCHVRTMPTEHGYLHSGSVESFERIRPYHHQHTKQISNSSSPAPLLDSTMILRSTRTAENNAYVLNLSTNNSNSTSFNYCNISPGPAGTQQNHSRRDEPMEFCEPLDFSKPLNLSKHEVMYRLEEDGVWRPW